MKHQKRRVLFLCIHNSARSQMAAALLTQMGGDRFDVESAGLGAGKLSPLAVSAMRIAGIDISKNGTQSVFELFEERAAVRVRHQRWRRGVGRAVPHLPRGHHAAELGVRRSVGVHRHGAGTFHEDHRRDGPDPREDPAVCRRERERGDALPDLAPGAAGGGQPAGGRFDRRASGVQQVASFVDGTASSSRS